MTKILLVEDDKSLREIYGVRLLAEGYDIVSAGDGEAALAMAIKEKPGLIVSDVMMPKISGFDMLDILRSTTETKDIKVIMMTALSSEDQRQRGVQLGADRYLVKSQVGIEDVVRTVHDVLGDLPGAMPATPPSVSTAPTPAAPQPAPVAPTAAPTPSVTMPTPMAAPATPQATPQPAVTPSGLPQPTAPFSTARPANLGDRVIHPLERPESSGPNMADRISEELGSQPMPPAPQPPVIPSPQIQIPVTDSPAVAPTPPTPTPTPPPLQEESGLSFEETPLQAPAPQTTSQPPSPPV
ncbi:MAG: sensor hybrid histidine kinase [Candidatus Saccharibacteria bacterium]|nr:sensor hybrid histidine kinase [Candidatus Saccharibacteria bacterium]